MVGSVFPCHTQVPEVETLLVLQRGIKRLVLVGDPRQLPGMVYSPMCKDVCKG